MNTGDRVQFADDGLSLSSVLHGKHRWRQHVRTGTVVGRRAGGKLAVKPDDGGPTVLRRPEELTTNEGNRHD